jgi:hypothetical protein
MEPACFVKLEAMDDGDAAELRQLRAHYLERLHLKDFNPRSNGASKAVLQHSFPQVWVACCELQALQRLGTLLRLLRAVAYYELHGVVRGEPPPSADYFGRKLSALTGGKDVLALECVIDLTADDGDRSRDCVVIDDHLMEHQQAWQAPGEAPEAGTAAAAFRTVIAPKAAAPRIKLEDEGSGGAALAAPARPKRAPRAKGAAKGAASRGARNKRKAQSHAPWDGEAESDSPGSDGEDTKTRRRARLQTRWRCSRRLRRANRPMLWRCPPARASVRGRLASVWRFSSSPRPAKTAVTGTSAASRRFAAILGSTQSLLTTAMLKSCGPMGRSAAAR